MTVSHSAPRDRESTAMYTEVSPPDRAGEDIEQANVLSSRLPPKLDGAKSRGPCPVGGNALELRVSLNRSKAYQSLSA